MCDEITKAFGAAAPEPVTVTVIDGQPELGPRRHVLGPDDAMVRRYGDAVWLIRDGRRSLINRRTSSGVRPSITYLVTLTCAGADSDRPVRIRSS